MRLVIRLKPDENLAHTKKVYYRLGDAEDVWVGRYYDREAGLAAALSGLSTEIGAGRISLGDSKEATVHIVILEPPR